MSWRRSSWEGGEDEGGSGGETIKQREEKERLSAILNVPVEH